MQCSYCRRIIIQKVRVKRLKTVLISSAIVAVAVIAVLGNYVHLLKIQRQSLVRDAEAMQKDMKAFIPPCMVKDIFVATSYEDSEQSCGKWAQYRRTKTMTTPAQLRTVAVDPEVIPLGSLVFVSGFGWGIAEDTGRLIKGKTIGVDISVIEWKTPTKRILHLCDSSGVCDHRIHAVRIRDHGWQLHREQFEQHARWRSREW